ncbi:hypothetical protein MTO96_002669 [Rhipicephalus appendiculatus]
MVFPVGKHLAKKLQEKRDGIIGEPALKESFFNNDTNDVFKEGEILRRPLFADTLQLIAEKGAEEFYTGELGKKFVQGCAANGWPHNRRRLEILPGTCETSH